LKHLIQQSLPLKPLQAQRRQRLDTIYTEGDSNFMGMSRLKSKSNILSNGDYQLSDEDSLSHNVPGIIQNINKI
jgi:hypothetical protein